MGVHDGEQNDVHHLYFMCDDLDTERLAGRRRRHSLGAVQRQLGPGERHPHARQQQDRPLRTAASPSLSLAVSSAAHRHPGLDPGSACFLLLLSSPHRPTSAFDPLRTLDHNPSIRTDV
jgi:hypothetical protein